MSVKLESETFHTPIMLAANKHDVLCKSAIYQRIDFRYNMLGRSVDCGLFAWSSSRIGCHSEERVSEIKKIAELCDSINLEIVEGDQRDIISHKYAGSSEIVHVEVPSSQMAADLPDTMYRGVSVFWISTRTLRVTQPVGLDSWSDKMTPLIDWFGPARLVQDATHLVYHGFCCSTYT